MATTSLPSSDPFQSQRLIYRAVETPEDDDLFYMIQTEPMAFINSNTRLKTPQSRNNAAHLQRYVADEALIGAVICLASDKADSTPSKPTLIGSIHLTRSGSTTTVHRHAEIAVDIIKQYQGQGYGSEAIRWCLKWGFEEGGLHRIGKDGFEYNEGATTLHERLEFKREGAHREYIWHKGRW